ncbi:unnamed protein product, partial [Hapterophycus canaliculatus]
MSAAIVQAASHKSWGHFAQDMYDEYIYVPKKENGELDHVMGQFDKLGFPGAMGSTDVTHVAWSRPP